MARIELGFSCDEDWDQMSPNERGRRCARCGEDVVDLSRLTRREAAALVRRPDAPCVSFLERPDGEAVFRAEARRASGLVTLGAIGLLTACATDEPSCELEADPAQLVVTEPETMDEPCELSAAVETPLAAETSDVGAPTSSELASAGDRNVTLGGPHVPGPATPPPVHPTVRRAGRRPSLHHTPPPVASGPRAFNLED